jgi:hypothetical protein
MIKGWNLALSTDLGFPINLSTHKLINKFIGFRDASLTRRVSYDCYNFEELSTFKLSTDLGFPINLSTHQPINKFIGL